MANELTAHLNISGKHCTWTPEMSMMYIAKPMPTVKECSSEFIPLNTRVAYSPELVQTGQSGRYFIKENISNYI